MKSHSFAQHLRGRVSSWGAWTEGDLVTPLIHGRHYFRRLHEVLGQTRSRDLALFTDWRGDSDERLAGPGTEVVPVLSGLAEWGVHVRGLIWRSHPDRARFSEDENLRFAEIINAAGGEVFLDERVRRAVVLPLCQRSGRAPWR